MSTTTTQKNIQAIAQRMTPPGKFTKEAALEARQAAEKLFAALPQSKQLSFIGCLNTICLFLEAAEKRIVDDAAPPEMQNWKSLLEKAIADKYPGTQIKWEGNLPMPIIPEEIENSREIVEYLSNLLLAWGGDGRVLIPSNSTND